MNDSDLPNTNILLSLDRADHKAILEACKMRKELVPYMPEGTSNEMGAVLAEICRGWMEVMKRHVNK